MEQFHGTSINDAQGILDNGINIGLGGGELGRGFYTGDQLYRAFNWAWHKNGNQKAVVCFNIPDDDFLNLDLTLLNRAQATRKRNFIRNNNQTRIYLFNVDAVWSPVVGAPLYNLDQIKFESIHSQHLLNGKNVLKQVL